MQRRRRVPRLGTLARLMASLGLMLLAGLCPLAVPSAAAAVGVDDGWADNFGFRGPNGPVNALAADKQGNIYASGEFTMAGGVVANYITRWDGAGWAPLGNEINGVPEALAVGSDGMLYAGGNLAGGLNGNAIARWNGTSWEFLGGGMNSTVHDLAIAPDESIYAGGFFTNAGGVATNYIARWTGTAWEPLGAGVNHSVRVLAVAPDGTLYAGGSFTSAGGVAANHIARWTGTAWEALGSGVSAQVFALAVAPDGTLYAGGDFTSAGGVAASHIARWNGTRWEALGSGMNGSVGSLVFAPDGTLYAGGWFSMLGEVTVNYIAQWTGTAWEPLDGGVNSNVNALAFAPDGTLYVGGTFTTAGSHPSSNIARWTPPAERVLYDEGYAPSWGERWSWGTNVQTVSDSTASGAEALRLDYTYGWGGFRMMSAGDNWTGYQTLRFALRGGVAEGQQVRVWIKTTSGDSFNLGVATAAADRWTTTELALPVGVDLSAVTELVFQEHTGVTPSAPFFLDAIALQRVASQPALFHIVPGGTGARTGADWANAIDLAPALAVASAGDELWLRAGTYRPGAPGDQAATFTIPDGVAIYGGFAGTETARDQRDSAANLTVLSGDLAGDDATGGLVVNADHVVTFGAVGPDTILDGVTVRDGSSYGSAIWNEGGSPQLANLTLTANTGGAMWTRGNPTLTNVNLSANSDYMGGAIFNAGGTLTLNRVTFHANIAKGGGAIWNQGDLIAIGSSFVGNRGTIGGAIYHQGGIVSMVNCRFEGNMAFNEGGAFSSLGGLITFTNTAFVGNTTSGSGGAISIHEAAPAFTNVVFSGNQANSGGALYQRAGTLTLTNVTASGNSATNTGGFFAPSVTLDVRNSIIWDNPGGDLRYDPQDATRGVIRHSLIISDALAFLTDGGGNLLGDPRFLMPVPPAPSSGGNLRLRTGSPAIDAGDPSLLPADLTSDLNGRPRVSGATVDMGAYEYEPLATRTLYGEGFGDGWHEQWSWGTNVQTVSDPTASGAEALRLDYSYGWAGFRMMSAGDDWMGYQTLRFALRGGPTASLRVRVWLKTSSGASYNLGLATAAAGRWTTAELALPAGVDLGAVSELVFQEHRGRTPREPIFLDQIELIW